MNIAPRYLGRGSWLGRRDPRVLILAVVCFVFGAVQVWDARLMLALLTIAALYYRAAGIPWRAVRYNWAYVFLFVGFIVTVNTIVSGGELRETQVDERRGSFYLRLFHTQQCAASV